MKVDSIKFGATVPVDKYANLQPELVISDVDLEEGKEIGMDFIKDFFKKYSETGQLKERDMSMTVVKTSFNEEAQVEFEPISHQYFHKGNKLVSATEYIKRFYKEFDNENVSKASAKAWGVEQDVVKGLWESNGDLTSSFGTVIHNALEHYDKFKEAGATISKKKELAENYSMPKHPFLKSIIEGFLAINKTVGTVVPEALITDIVRGFCGHADRVLIIDEAKKVCRVQDYKVNINSEEVTPTLKINDDRFGHLPANKISKYQLQMSFYANMLQKSGWTVEGLDVFIFENEWKHYSLDVLNVIN